jgi:APA family basic amino acid/polyamine antiporter
MDWVFMTLAAIGLFYFRRKTPVGSYQGFQTPLYPLVPLIFIGISLWFISYTLLGKPAQAWAGIILLLLGLPVYYLSRNS